MWTYSICKSISPVSRPCKQTLVEMLHNSQMLRRRVVPYHKPCMKQIYYATTSCMGNGANAQESDLACWHRLLGNLQYDEQA